MPCWTRTETTVNLANSDPERLKKAAEALGYRVVRVDSEGNLTVSGARSVDMGAVKRQYAALTVQEGLKRFGWKVQKKQDLYAKKQIQMKVGR